LQTIAQHRLPIKIFVLDNHGYLSIRSSQMNFFRRVAGADPDSGVSLPDFVAIATAFAIPASRLDSADFAERLPTLLDAPGPHLCQIVLDETQQFEPRMSSRQLDDGSIVSAPLEDMYPFLEPAELARNMLSNS
ncbi:MAG: thiamine pyrophosphate-binding protein, partial [Candidatus Accumulibacter sp.]|nr:thiamine pyrophosphate-binding protein [Accumulibacter sp.]